ncbi:ABC transporter permease [Micromonospora sp. SH-82]|uniref:ABC transporter permease n=1 Tax=Micromonospora sp. SH-82 TaxID=3132938 RepID=UPI003EC0949F
MTTAAGTESGLGNLLAQGAVLAGRNLRHRATAEMAVMFVVFPLIFVFGFLLLFGRLFDARGLDYAQFLPPAIVAQWMFTVANTSGAASAADRASGMYRRCLVMPVNRGAIALGRVAGEAVWAFVAAVVISATGHLAGFRFHGGIAATVGFVALAVAFALVLTAATTAVGLSSGDPAAVAALLNLPYLALIMLSTAFVPADAFPGWLEPVIRNSPVSVVIEALRSLASATPAWTEVRGALVWVAVLGVVFGAVAARTLRRTR